jgi:GntR family transcriptional regulator/MocR family aminotransferase
MLEQAALYEFMLSGEYERHIRRMRRLYRRRRDTLVRCLQETFGERATVGARHGGLNLLVSLRSRLGEAELTARAAGAGIGLRPAASYYSQPPVCPTFLLGFAAVTEQQIAEGIERLATFVA